MDGRDVDPRTPFARTPPGRRIGISGPGIDLECFKSAP
jgi:hypothetical protein